MKATVTTVDEILGQVLRDAVWERLARLAELADRTDTPCPLSVARAELPRLTAGWRTLLTAHEPDKKGDCPECSALRRPRRAPCPVWYAAYEHLVNGALAPRPTRHLRAAHTPEPHAACTAAQVPHAPCP